jgi:hypothetical protein
VASSSQSDAEFLRTAESVVLDGANGVSAEPRQHFPHAWSGGAITGLALVLTLLMLRLRARVWMIAVGLLCAAVPGGVIALAVRADAPLKRPALASEVRGALVELQARAPWRGGHVRLMREDDDVLFPLGRYAIPTRPEANPPSIDLELRGGSLKAQCRWEGRHLVCGGDP